MNEKQHKLLNILSNYDFPISSSELATVLQISSRTVKKYIAEVNQEYKNLIQSSPRGYFVNKLLLSDFRSGCEVNSLPQTQTQRVNYILLSLLRQNNDCFDLNIYDISEEIFVSEATIRRDFQVIKELCSSFDIEVSTNSEHLRLIGKEKNKRQLMNYIYRAEYESSELNIEKIQELYPQYNAFQIRDIIEKICLDNHYIINKLASAGIVLDTIISIDRMKHSFISEDSENQESLFNYHELLLAQKILKQFECLYGIKYNREETEQFTILLFSHLLRVDYEKMTEADLPGIVGEETYQLSKKLLREAGDNFLKDPSTDFFIRFTLHLSNLMLRLKSGVHNQNDLNNSLTDTIRNSCPFLFDCAVRISNLIHNETGYIINEDEIAYIALHIGCFLENDNSEKLSCTLIIPKYYNLSSNIQSLISKEFSSSLMIVQVYSDPMDYFSGPHTDLVISTVDFPHFPWNNGVLISYLLTKKDLKNIEQKLKNLQKEREKIVLLNQFLSVTNASYFKKNDSYSSKELFISQMCSRLKQDGFVDENYEQNVLKRENMSSTVFNQIAVPHSMKMDAQKTMISIHIFDKPVSWGKRDVNLVLLFAIHPNDIRIFHHILDYLVIQLSELKNLNKIIKCDTYEQFIKVLLSFY